MGFVDKITLTYVDNMPRHVVKQDESYFLIVPKTNFYAMTPPIAQGHLRCRYIVIPDMNLPALAFDRQGFRQLDSLHSVVDIEGSDDISTIFTLSSEHTIRSDNQLDGGRPHFEVVPRHVTTIYGKRGVC